jgi:hypothetical protein
MHPEADSIAEAEEDDLGEGDGREILSKPVLNLCLYDLL